MSPQRTVAATLFALAVAAPWSGATVPVLPLDPIVAPESRGASVLGLDNPPTVRTISFSVPKYRLTDAERELVASCLVLEAASQGEFGMRGVMAVIRNRSRGLPELFAPTVLREKQFSALNKLTAGRESVARVVRRAQSDRMWETALAIVDDAVDEGWHDPTDGATHYTRTGERTPWTRTLARTVTIGRHAFYR